jgi:Tir chaperone protein (CesT) family
VLHAEAIEMVNSYIRRFGHAVAVDLHLLDSDGYTDVRHGTVVIGINACVERNVLLILARMGSVSDSDSPKLYRKLLELNFLTTRACCFAIDEQRQCLYLRAMRSLDALEYEEFVDLLENVASVAETLRPKFAELMA